MTPAKKLRNPETLRSLLSQDQPTFRRQRRRASYALDLTPLIDIVFQLIAFFAFATGFQSLNADIHPPNPDLEGETGSQYVGVVLMEMNREGKTWVRQRPVEDGELRPVIESEVATGATIVIRADARTVYADVQRVITILRELDVTNVKLQIRGEP